MNPQSARRLRGRPARVLIVDDHPLVRSGLTQIIELEDDLEPCGEAEDAAGALAEIESENPDIVILDISLRGVSGLDLLKEITARGLPTRVLVLSMHEETLYAERVMRAGARGYVMKQEAPATVLRAIRRVLDGEVYLSEAMEARTLRHFAGDPSPESESHVDRLTDRELEVFGLVGRAWSTREIAEALHLSVKTVEAHREHIKEKLNLKGATELIQQATLWVQAEGGSR